MSAIVLQPPKQLLEPQVGLVILNINAKKPPLTLQANGSHGAAFCYMGLQEPASHTWLRCDWDS